MAGEIKSLFLDGPAGKLEALLNVGEANARHAALICHPHPLFGGTMHNKVVYNAMKALAGFGFPCLRFNFRGNGLSEGRHDEGRGERGDVRAGLDWLEREYGLPIIFAGFSFGAGVGAKVACPDPRVAAIILLGAPIAAEGREYRWEFLRECMKPKLFVSGGEDEYCPELELREVVANAAEPKRMVIVPGVDHYFAGKLPDMQQVIRDWVSTLFAPTPPLL